MLIVSVAAVPKDSEASSLSESSARRSVLFPSSSSAMESVILTPSVADSAE